MIHLGILLTQHHRLLSVAAMLDLFETANEFCAAEGCDEHFEITLLHTANSKPVSYSAHPIYPLQTAPQQDLILIPSFASNNLPAGIDANIECIPWLQQQYRNGAEIAGFCTGVFLLAATGLLDNKPATTHIQSAPAFARNFPKVQLRSAEVTTFDQGIYTGGGATNSFHLMLRMLEKYCGPTIAVRTAKYFAIDMNREQQAYFSTFQPVQNHKDELVKTLQQRIEHNFGEATSIEELLSEIPSSRRNLVRRFKAATGVTPIEYLQKIRIEAAKSLLEQTDKSVLDVMLHAGYNDLKTFRQLFRKNTGMTPTAYRDKFYRAQMIELT
ncbi:helix-turn-helix domain-containing protein [Deminuibacter soli]|uniref:Helix-turn-helix domain-containing protein n=2 Tax=Deminuibacter soli TaxID=2291815 RepID=A0A3E1ND18_9BACT|nr:helix-turn-helix domain-containing protein [Deminuibacter soli]